jgi:hypothetical protein
MMCLQVEQTKSRLKQENYDTILWYNLPGDGPMLTMYQGTILWYNVPDEAQCYQGTGTPIPGSTF